MVGSGTSKYSHLFLFHFIPIITDFILSDRKIWYNQFSDVQYRKIDNLIISAVGTRDVASDITQSLWLNC